MYYITLPVYSGNAIQYTAVFIYVFHTFAKVPNIFSNYRYFYNSCQGEKCVMSFPLQNKHN